MPDWTKPMQQSFEYYEVDPATWTDTKKLNNVKSTSINRDSGVETLGSAAIDITESVGECYIRPYMVTVQNGITERHALDTFLVQTPQSSFNGKIRNVSMDAYTPLLELKEKHPPIGYHIPKGENVMDVAYRIVSENVRAPVVPAKCDIVLHRDFVSEINDTWLSFLIDLISYAKFVFELDDKGRILFAPKQDAASLQPVWTYTDDNSSILYPDIDLDHDLYGIPNVVEVVYSTNNEFHYARAVNNDENSPTSIVNRGREIVYRVTDPSALGNATDEQVKDYAERVLREVSTLEYTITYTHGYCPVRLNDCVRINYNSAGLTNIKAKVISQDIKCKPGCSVTEKAVFTIKLWE